jgi:hypothetical protein
MGYRSTYNRRLRAIKRLQKRLAIGSLLGVTASAAAFVMLDEPWTVDAASYTEADAAPASHAARSVTLAAVSDAHPGARAPHPSSAVPGGAADVRRGSPSAQVLATAMSTDVDAADADAHRAGARTSYQAGLADGSRTAPAYARVAATPAFSGVSGAVGGAVASIRSTGTVALAPPTASNGAGMAGRSSVSSGTSGAPSDGSAGWGPGGVAGTWSGSGDLVAAAGPSGTGPSGTGTGSGAGAISAIALATAPRLGPVVNPAGAGPKDVLVPLPAGLTPLDLLPVVQDETPGKSAEVPEPGTPWLSGMALAAILLLRRAPRRTRSA